MDIEYLYHMLAAEFGYTRDYVDKYINMPSLRSLINYRNDNPPVGTMLKIVFGDDKKTIKKNKKQKESLDSSKFQREIGGISKKVNSSKFERDLQLLRNGI